jgi:hypothetical protein
LLLIFLCGKKSYLILKFDDFVLKPMIESGKRIGWKNGSGSGFVECVVGTEIGGGFPVRTGWWGEAPPKIDMIGANRP